MKIQLFAEEIYGGGLIGEYEFIPVSELDVGENIQFQLTEILDEMPTTFVTMQTILSTMDEGYRTCLEKFSGMDKKYTKHDCYTFEHEGHRLSKFTRVIVVDTQCEFSKDTLTGDYYLPENGTLKLTIKPLKCSICRTDKSFINPVKVKIVFLLF